MFNPPPTTKAEIRAPFGSIGDTGWDTQLRGVFEKYQIASEIDIPAPASEESIRLCEKRLGISLPQSVRTFLLAMGPLHFEFLRIYPPEKIEYFESIPIGFDVKPEREISSAKMLAVAEQPVDEGDEVDIYFLEPATGKIYLGSFLYNGFFELLPSFDNLIKNAIVELSWGFFGWNDRNTHRMAEEIASEELGLLDFELD